MKRKSLHLIGTVMCLVFVLTQLFVSVAFASPNNNNQITLQELSQKYNLKDISPDSVPANIQPIKFESVNELASFLAKVKSINDKINLENQNAAKKITASSE